MTKNFSKWGKSVLKIVNTKTPQPHPLGLILLLCVSLCSETVNAYPKPTPSTPPPQLPTQTNIPNSNRAAAEKAEQEAGQLGKQKAPLLTKIIPKYEEALKYWRLAGDRNKEAKTLNKIAGFYWLRGEYPKAIEYAKKALPICQALGDKECKGAVTSSLSLIYDQIGEYQKAIDIRLQVPSLFPKSLDLPSIAYTTVAQIYSNKLGEKQKAIEYYNKALTFWKEKGDVIKQAELLDNIAVFYFTSGEINTSFDYIKQANTLDPEFKRNRKLYDLMYLVLNTASCEDKLASLKKPPQIDKSENSPQQSGTPNSDAATNNSIEYYKQQVQKYHTQENLRAEAGFLSDLGNLTYTRIGEYNKALEVHQKALKIRQIMGDKPEEAKTLTDIANILNQQGKKQEAINALNQALDIQRQIKARPDEANTLITIGNVYSSLGAYTDSIDTYKKALSLWKNIGQRSRETDTLMSIGDVYRKLQDYPQALNYYQQALDVSTSTGDCNNEAYLLERISRNYLSSGDYQQAISFANKTLNLSRNLGISEQKLLFEAGTLNIRAQVEIKQGNYSQALEDSQKARKLARESGYKHREANVVTATAEAYAALKQPQKAIQTYQEQLALYGEMGLVSEQAQSLYNITKLQRQNNQLQQALTEIDKAIKIIENIRQEVASSDLRTSFFATVQDYYRLKIDILMELHKKDPSKGYDAQAIETSERSRARGLVELLTEARANIRKGAKPELLAEESRLQGLIDAKEKLRFEIVNSNKIKDPTYKANADNFQKEIDELLSQQKELETKIRESSPKYAHLKYPQPLTLPQIQQQLDKDTLLLQYSLGEERSYLWAVTPTSMQVYTLPPREEIEKVATRFHSSLQQETGSDFAIDNAQQLSKLILAPVADKLPGKRLVIVADGALQTIPFAALADITPQAKSNAEKEVKYQPLMVNHEIVNLPSASTIAIQRQELANRPLAPKALAILADPVYSATDIRVTGKPEKSDKPQKSQLSSELELEHSALESSARSLKRNGWERLINTATEAKEILKLIPPASRLEAVDFDANYNWATSSALKQFRILHFATHGFVNQDQPELSGIVLSLVDKKGNKIHGHLRLADLFNQDYPAELIVLSACETGLGKNINGEGLVGLTRGLMYAGAARVVVSLWQVSDEGTSVLMQEFYKQMLQQGKTPTEALRVAQRKLWQDGHSPYEWAAFTMQGEWR